MQRYEYRIEVKELKNGEILYYPQRRECYYFLKFKWVNFMGGFVKLGFSLCSDAQEIIDKHKKDFIDFQNHKITSIKHIKDGGCESI